MDQVLAMAGILKESLSNKMANLNMIKHLNAIVGLLKVFNLFIYFYY
jgi:hypothetical protein